MNAKLHPWTHTLVGLALAAGAIAACSTQTVDNADPIGQGNVDGGTTPAPPGRDSGARGDDDASALPGPDDGGDVDASTAPVGKDDGGDGGGDGGSTQATTVHVTAAAGGTISDPSGNTTLVIPPGALAADTDITLTLLAKSGAAVVAVSEFGPNGLTFSSPATLSIKAAPSLAPQGKTLAIGLHDGTDFKAVAGSTYASGVATAPISHFSMFSVVVIDGEVVVQPGAACDDLKAGFTACGGDMTGTWVMKQLCLDQTPIGGNPGCPDLKGTMEFDAHDREITFDATTMVLPAGTFTITTTIDYPRSCAGNATCAQLEQSMSGYACTDKSPTVCACTHAEEEPQDAENLTYTAAGGKATMSDGSSMEFCVKGDVLVLKNLPTDPEDPPSMWRLDRKK